MMQDDISPDLAGPVPMSTLRVSQSQNQGRRRNNVSSPEEEIIAKRGRREMPKSPPKYLTRHQSHLLMINNIGGSARPADRQQQQQLSPLTKCIRSISASQPPRSKPLDSTLKGGYNLRLRRRLFSPETTEELATASLTFYYSPNTGKLRRRDSDGDDSGIDLTSPELSLLVNAALPTASTPIAKTAATSSKAKSKKKSGVTLKEKATLKSGSMKKSPLQNAALVHRARRRLCF